MHLLCGDSVPTRGRGSAEPGRGSTGPGRGSALPGLAPAGNGGTMQAPRVITAGMGAGPCASHSSADGAGNSDLGGLRSPRRPSPSMGLSSLVTSVSFPLWDKDLCRSWRTTSCPFMGELAGHPMQHRHVPCPEGGPGRIPPPCTACWSLSATRTLAAVHAAADGCRVAGAQRLGRSGSYWAVAVFFMIGLFVVGAFILYKFKRQGRLAAPAAGGVRPRPQRAAGEASL